LYLMVVSWSTLLLYRHDFCGEGVRSFVMINER
jgi:hypothetical protein